MNFNNVQLAGNTTRDIELRYTPKGTAVAEVGIAVNKRIPGRDGEEAREEVTFVDVTFFGKTAEVLGQYAQKGTGLFIEGELKLERWEDKVTGKAQSRLKVMGQRFQFTGSPRSAGGGGKREPAPVPGQPETLKPDRAADGLEEEDEIPF